MALKTCIECGKEHTDTIANCPHCGFVTKEHPSLKEAKNEKIDVEDIVQNIFKAVQPEKKSGLQGYFHSGNQLITLLRVIGASLSVFFITLIISGTIIEDLFAYILILAVTPYLFYKKEDFVLYKILGYTVWGMLLIFNIYDFITKHILEKEEAILLNSKIINIISSIF